MIGYRFSKYRGLVGPSGRFEQLLDMFMKLLNITSGDVSETLNWMNELDRRYGITNDEYGMGDFIDDLKEKGTSMKKIPELILIKLRQNPKEKYAADHLRKFSANFANPGKVITEQTSADSERIALPKGETFNLGTLLIKLI